MQANLAARLPDANLRRARSDRVVPVTRFPGMLTAEQYRGSFGWTVDEREDGPHLVMAHGMAAVVMPPRHGAHAADLLRRDDARGPVLSVHGTVLSWVFLADQNDIVLCRGQLPLGVRLLGCPSAIPLPAPGSASVRWVVPPRRNRRWLPTVSAVLNAVPCARASAIS